MVGRVDTTAFIDHVHHATCTACMLRSSGFDTAMSVCSPLARASELTQHKQRNVNVLGGGGRGGFRCLGFALFSYYAHQPMAQVRPPALDIFASLSYSAIAEVTAWFDKEGVAQVSWR